MLARLAGGTSPAHVAGLLPGPDRRARDRRGRRAGGAPGRACAPVVTRTLMTDDDARARGSRTRVLDAAGCARVRVAILGGTGSFGRALAARLVALGEDEVVIGSRDAERARGGRGRARRRRDGRDERGRRSRRRPRRARGQGRRGARHRARGRRRARRDAAALGRERARRSRRTASGPTPDARSLAERIQEVVAAPVVAGPPLDRRREPRRRAAATRTRSSAATTRARRSSRSSSPRSVVAGRALDAGPLASARTLEGLTAVIVNLNRRYKAHAGIRVTGISDA